WTETGGLCKGSGRASSLEFLDNVNNNYLAQVVKEPTFGSNTLDLVFVDDPNRIYSVDIGPPISVSKLNQLHSTLTWEFHLKEEAVKNQNKANRFLYHKGKYDLFNKSINDINWYELNDELNENEMFELFLEKYDKASNNFIQKIKVSSGVTQTKAKPKWFNSNIKKLTRNKYQLWIKLRANNKKDKNLIEEYNRVSKSVKSRVKDSIVNYEKSIISKAKKNPKLLYTYINEQKKIKDSIRSLNVDNKIIVKDEEIANCLSDCFFQVFTKHNDDVEFPHLSNLSEAQRWKIIGLLKDKTKSQQEMADLGRVSRKCMITTKRNYEKTSVVKELPRSGRPRKLTSRDESYIFRRVIINPSTSYRQLASDFSSKFPNVPASSWLNLYQVPILAKCLPIGQKSTNKTRPALHRQPCENFAVNQDAITPNTKPATLEPFSQNENAINTIRPNQASLTILLIINKN
ncbi:hypothetical protein BpHYR1_016995, partial [Brachionus plicatilis]